MYTDHTLQFNKYTTDLIDRELDIYIPCPPYPS